MRFRKHQGKNLTPHAMSLSLFFILPGLARMPQWKQEAHLFRNSWIPKTQTKSEPRIFATECSAEGRFFRFPSYEIAFGARPRDFGYQPKTLGEVAHWYGTFIDICTCLALSAQPIAKQARKILADNLRDLWTEAHMFEALEISAKQLQEQKAWNEGWIAVRSIIRYDNKKFEEEISERLHT